MVAHLDVAVLGLVAAKGHPAPGPALLTQQPGERGAALEDAACALDLAAGDGAVEAVASARAERAEKAASAWQLASGCETPAQAFAARRGPAWQCSGCHHVCRAWECPRACLGCGRVGYYSGSANNAAVSAYDTKAWEEHCAANGVNP